MKPFFSNFIIIKTFAMKKITIFLFAVLGILAWQSCSYDWIEPEKPVVPTVVSFKDNIQPIFDADCISCHKTGGEAPDLSFGVAYNDLWSAGMIDTAAPANSVLYKKVEPQSGTTVAGSMNKYITNPNDPALILQWIEEGAKNN